MSRGPVKIMRYSCRECEHCVSVPYCCAAEVTCTHPEVRARRIGDTTWDTPAWCPELDNAKEQGHG